MKRYLIFFLLLSLTSLACTTTAVSTSTGDGDPREQIRDAQATQAAASAAIQETADAKAYAVQQTQLARRELEAREHAVQTSIAVEANATAQAWRIEQEKAQATQMAASITQAALASQVAASQAVAATNAAATPTAASLQATQTSIAGALIANQQRAERSRRAAEFWSYARPIMEFVVIVLVIIFGGRALLDFLDWLKVWADRPRQFVETRSNTFVLMDGEWFPVGSERSAGNALTRYGPSQAPSAPSSVVVSPGGCTVTGPAPSRSARGMVLHLLYEAMQIAGQDTNMIPGHRPLRWTPGRWTNAVDILEHSGYARAVQGSGTYLTEMYSCLADLCSAVESGRAKLYPPPPRESG
jgi:hypothetical protein